MLEDYKNQIEKMTYQPLKAPESEKYRMAYEEYLMWKDNFNSRKRDFFSKLESYSEKRNDFSYKATVGALASHFTIIIKDGREFNVYLVAESRDADLALLKLDGYKTPYVKPALRQQTRQGQDVYAIGSPTGLRDSVSSVIISGYERDIFRVERRTKRTKERKVAHADRSGRKGDRGKDYVKTGQLHRQIFGACRHCLYFRKQHGISAVVCRQPYIAFSAQQRPDRGYSGIRSADLLCGRISFRSDHYRVHDGASSGRHVFSGRIVPPQVVESLAGFRHGPVQFSCRAGTGFLS
jgi:hypothetical protein